MRTYRISVIAVALLAGALAVHAMTTAPATQKDEPRTKAMAAARTAAEKALTAQAGVAVVVTGSPQIAEAESAWTFTWQGHVDAGDYLVTVRANEKGETKVLQAKIGAGAARD